MAEPSPKPINYIVFKKFIQFIKIQLSFLKFSNFFCYPLSTREFIRRGYIWKTGGYEIDQKSKQKHTGQLASSCFFSSFHWIKLGKKKLATTVLSFRPFWHVIAYYLERELFIIMYK